MKCCGYGYLRPLSVFGIFMGILKLRNNSIDTCPKGRICHLEFKQKVVVNTNCMIAPPPTTPQSVLRMDYTASCIARRLQEPIKFPWSVPSNIHITLKALRVSNKSKGSRHDVKSGFVTYIYTSKQLLASSTITVYATLISSCRSGSCDAF